MEEPSLSKSIARVRLIGYGLLLFWLIDTLQILIPPNFMNPSWEFQTFGAIVERVAVPLLGFALVFWGEYEGRVAIEELILKILSWLCLVLMVVFLLMLPLGIVNTVRLSNQAAQQIDSVAEQDLARLQTLQDQVKNAKPTALAPFVERLRQEGVQVDSQNPDQIRDALSKRVEALREQVQKQSGDAKQRRRLSLIEDSVKWNLGALITATLFFCIWKSTGWAR